jgi:hypothetical protein
MLRLRPLVLIWLSFCVLGLNAPPAGAGGRGGGAHFGGGGAHFGAHFAPHRACVHEPTYPDSAITSSARTNMDWVSRFQTCAAARPISARSVVGLRSPRHT